MSNVEKLSDFLASKVSTKLPINQDEKEVIAYGTFVLLQTILTIVILAVFGIVFNVLLEILIISTSSSLLRKYSGGAHATHPINCALISLIVFGTLALLEKNLIVNIDFKYIIVLIIIVFTFTYYIMKKFSPVGTSTKPLKNENIRKRLKRKSINFVHILLGINLVWVLTYLQTDNFKFISIALCISLGIVWQSITMVSLGYKIIYSLDAVLGGTNKLLRRTK